MWVRKSKSLFFKQDKKRIHRFTISVIIAEPPEHVVSCVYKMLTSLLLINLFISIFAPNNIYKISYELYTEGHVAATKRVFYYFLYFYFAIVPCVNNIR